METETPTLASLAEEASRYFTTKKRGDETIVTLTDERPEWVHDLVYAAHTDFLPDDWRYQTIAAAVDEIASADTQYLSDDGLSDLGHEFADGVVDVYTHDRFAWLSSHLSRQAYVEQARDEGLIDADSDITEQIGVGQFMEAREIFDSVLASVIAKRDELD